MRKPISVIAPLALAAVALAGCGSSKAPGIQAAPSGGATQAAVTATSTTATTPTTTVTTPKPPSPLSKEPVISVPKTPAPSKLVTKDLVTGTGQAAKAGDTVTVNYVGALYKGGKVFDSSWSRKQTFTTALTSGSGGVIEGWVQGIAGMKVGGRRELIIPPNLAYGKSGSGSTIPPNSTLVFVVDLLSVSSSS
jgi:FKBP-type peptidyl-prolyl cis-trans isomerase